LHFLAESWPEIKEFRIATELAAVQSLRQSGIRDVLQTVVNDWIRVLEPGSPASAEPGRSARV
jgi:hypothetical protein